MRRDCRVGNARRRRSKECFRIRIFCPDQLEQSFFDRLPRLRVAEHQTVVTLDWAFDPAGPGERVIRPEEYGFCFQQAFCCFFSHTMFLSFDSIYILIQ